MIRMISARPRPSFALSLNDFAWSGVPPPACRTVHHEGGRARRERDEEGRTEAAPCSGRLADAGKCRRLGERHTGVTNEEDGAGETASRAAATTMTRGAYISFVRIGFLQIKKNTDYF